MPDPMWDEEEWLGDGAFNPPKLLPFNAFVQRYSNEMLEIDPLNRIPAAVGRHVHDHHPGRLRYSVPSEQDLYCSHLSEAREWIRLGLSVDDVVIWIEGGMK